LFYVVVFGFGFRFLGLRPKAAMGSLFLGMIRCNEAEPWKGIITADCVAKMSEMWRKSGISTGRRIVRHDCPAKTVLSLPFRFVWSMLSSHSMNRTISAVGEVYASARQRMDFT
jgi:hypothetical protein